MDNREKALRISIQGDASPLAAATRQAVGHLNEVKSAAMAMVSGFTGGLIGGGVVGAIEAVVQMVGTRIREAKELLEDADRLNVDPGTARGIKSIASATGVPVDAAIQAARSARSEALAGDPNFTRAFERLGISLKSIQDVDPATLFYRLVDAMEKFDPAAENAKETFAALASILGGRGVAGDLTAFARGGLFREQRLFGGSGEIMAALLSGDPRARAKYKADFELPGAFGVGDEVRAGRINEETFQREAARRRSLLSLEQQLKDVVAERLRIEKAMADTSDAVRRARLLSDVVTLNSEADRIRQQMGMGGGVAALRNVQPDVDAFARMGLFVGGGRGVSLQEQQLAAARELVQEIRQMRGENDANWGS